MARILRMIFRIWCKICFVFCIAVVSLFLLVFLFFSTVHVVGYIYCNDKEALQKYAQEVKFAESARQEVLLIKKYGLTRLEPNGMQEDGVYVSRGGYDARYAGVFIDEYGEKGNEVAVAGDEERNQHKMWKAKIKSVSQYSAWRATPYHVDYRIGEGVIKIPLYGKCGQHAFLYFFFNEESLPAASPPPWIPSEGTLVKIDDGVYWWYSFWPFVRG